MVRQIRPIEYKEIVDKRWQLLDVREDWEVALAAICDSIPIPMADVPARLDELDRSRPVAVICHSGVRSDRVASFLQTQGFETVANIAGGIDEWSVTVDTAIPRY